MTLKNGGNFTGPSQIIEDKVFGVLLFWKQSDPGLKAPQPASDCPSWEHFLINLQQLSFQFGARPDILGFHQRLTPLSSAGGAHRPARSRST
jgi:hypothetical protein